MKITVIILLCTTFNLLAKGSYSQSERISLDMNKSSLESVLKNIEKSSEFYFLFNNELINVDQKVSINVSDQKIDEILNQLFKNTDVVYHIVGKQIILTASPQEKIKTQITTTDKKTIRGKVIDINGAPLPGATVMIVGTTQGGITDAEGYYSLDAEKGDVLRFSFIGYKNQDVVVDDKTSIDIILKEDITTLDEAVVVGMGKQRKASVVGSISTISVNDLKVPSRSLTNALSGRMSGAVVVQRSGEPGNDEASFWIRGISTFGANKKPLVLVDGVERDMSDISVDEIESISILKDASATAVYGVRAANGVVLVTTRRGIAQKTSVEINMEYGVADLPNMPEYLDGPDYMRLYNEAYGSTNFSDQDIRNTQLQTDPYLYPNVNWFDETFKKYSQNAQTNINIRGGGQVARYFVSFGYLDETGNLKNDPSNAYKSNIDLQRYNFRSNVDISLNKTLTMDIEVGGYLKDLHTPGLNGTLNNGKELSPAESVFYWANLATPISCPVKVPIGVDEKGNEIMGWGAPGQIGERNPAERLFGSGYKTIYQNQINSQIRVTQDLDKILKGLKVMASYSFDAYSQTKITRTKTSSTYSVQGRDPETDKLLLNITEGQDFLNFSKEIKTNRAKEMKFQLTYDNVFNSLHRVGAMAMYYQRDYIIGNASTSIAALPYRKQGMAIRTTYSYNDRYMAEFNMGYNGSENFPEGKRFGVFPAGALGWLVSNEPFWQPLSSTINIFKIKGSMGLVGAEALPKEKRYAYLSTYTDSEDYGYKFGPYATTYIGTRESQIGVSNLTWETGFKKNIGFELKMFDNTISIDADYFHEKRSDILIQRTTIPSFTGLTAAPFANMGEMINQGFDGTLEINKQYKNGGFKLYGNMTYAHNKITEKDEARKEYEYRMQTGQKYGQQFGLIALGYFKDEQDIANSPVQMFGEYRPGDVKYKDINGDGQITVDDKVPIGYSNVPELVYGFGVQFDYKGFDLGVFFRGQARVSYDLGGAYIPFIQGVGKGNLYKEALDRWTVENPRQDARYPRLYNGTSSNNWQESTKNIYNGSFLRLADIEFGKTFKQEMLKSIGIKGLRFYVHVTNAAIFSKWKMWDPETGNEDGQNNDGSKYPLQRKMNIGIRANF